MNTGFICKNTNTVARLVVRVVENPDALSNMSMQKERLPFLAMSVSVITRIAVAIIIHPKNILNITPFVYNHSRSRHCSCKHGTALDSAVYFKDNPDVLTRDQSVGESFQAALCKFIEKKPVLIVPSYIPLSYVDRSLSHYEINPLYRYLCNVFGEEETIRLFQLYRIGASVKWGGSAVFWQIDINGLVRTGKIMCYNPENGHRIKEPQAFVSWAHSELRMPDFHLKQCLFGEHLLKGSSGISCDAGRE